MKRPECYEFGMEFMGDPEQTEIRKYVEWLENRVSEITEARLSLAIGMSFRLVETSKRKFAVQLFWGETELLFPCLKKNYGLIAAGSVHYLITHNTDAILVGKDTFDVNIGEKIVTLPIRKREPNAINITSEWTYNTKDLRASNKKPLI